MGKHSSFEDLRENVLSALPIGLDQEKKGDSEEARQWGSGKVQKEIRD